ncbi:terpene synthase family protein [Dyella nitratireducens]|uniref:Terpene synthase n=1 Tax=Dyella nitratireducens TaxID=1849580 RepID=A0ABQ1GQJ3_9GAMM|nr:sesquiterpene cyclase [Dyella nitratireducens]GGA48067.1 hypothetical protein GCM10010981_41570 [Dyella nitratireducens]GLQ42365.1 hypothetical protein GCM10007902_22150 [Dyella nitratireducens]
MNYSEYLKPVRAPFEVRASRAPTGLNMPNLYYPWASACSPHAPFVEAHMQQWLTQHGLVPNEHYRARLARAKFGWLAARCHPYASMERLQTIANFYAWYFLIDDWFVGHTEKVSTYTISNLTAVIDVLDSSRTGEEPVYGETAWADLCRDLRSNMADAQFDRFAHAMHLWVGMAGLRMLEHTHAQAPQPHRHEAILRHAGGLYPCFYLIDFANDLPLSTDEHDRPNVQQLRRHTNRIVCWSSDVQHLGMDIRQSAPRRNAVALYTSQGYSLQHSVDRVSERIRTELEAFLRTATVVKENAGPALSHYISGLKHWMSGYRDWLAAQHGTRPFAEPDAAITAW